MIRDQYQGGSTIMTAISGVEIALWDLIGKACGQPVYRLLGGRCHDRIRAYANGWYGGARTPAGICRAGRRPPSRAAIARSSSTRSARPGSRSIPSEADLAVEIVAAVRKAVGPASA